MTHPTVTFKIPEPIKIDLAKDLPILEAAATLYSRLLRVELNVKKILIKPKEEVKK